MFALEVFEKMAYHGSCLGALVATIHTLIYATTRWFFNSDIIATVPK